MERFWSKVKRGKADECWLWQGGKSGNYGMFMYKRNGQHAAVRAHRMAAYLHGLVPTVEAPANKLAHGFVMHTCDNPLCCNPAHLRIGTYRENNEQKMERGRFKPNKPHGGRLSPIEVSAVRALRIQGWTHEFIAALFKCSTRTINRYLK